MAGLKFHRVTSLPTASTALTGNIYFNETNKTINICTGSGWSTYKGTDTDTNTWRPVVNNLTSTSADSSLSAAMGKSLNDSITSLSNSLAKTLKIDGSNGTPAGVSALINKLDAGSSTPTDADYYVCQYAGGGTTNTTYYRRPMSAMWNWIKAKTDTLYPTKSGSGASGTWGISISGNAATATKIGTSTVGSSTMPVYIKSGAPTAITSFPEAYLSWG